MICVFDSIDMEVTSNYDEQEYGENLLKGFDNEEDGMASVQA